MDGDNTNKYFDYLSLFFEIAPGTVMTSFADNKNGCSIGEELKLVSESPKDCDKDGALPGKLKNGLGEIEFTTEIPCVVTVEFNFAKEFNPGGAFSQLFSDPL